jgi:hypothetical protein
MLLLSVKNQFRSPVLVALLGLVVLAGGVLFWRLASKTAPAVGVGPAILTAQGAHLSAFFEGLPVSPGANRIQALNAKKNPGPRSLAQRVQHFLGLATVVHSQDNCVGCNASLGPPPPPCGCEGVSQTLYSYQQTGSGEYHYWACDWCGDATDATDLCGGQGCN